MIRIVIIFSKARAEEGGRECMRSRPLSRVRVVFRSSIRRGVCVSRLLLLFMPPAVGTTKSKKTGKKPKAPALPNSKKTGISQPRKKPLEHTTQISKKKSDKASRKTSSSAVSGKVGEIVSPLVLNYWNGRGLMEVPRMMLGKHVSSCSQKN